MMEREFPACNSAYSANYYSQSKCNTGNNVNYYFGSVGSNYSDAQHFKQPHPHPHHQFQVSPVPPSKYEQRYLQNQQKFYAQHGFGLSKSQLHQKQQFLYQSQGNFPATPYEVQGNFSMYPYSTPQNDVQRFDQRSMQPVQHSNYQPPTNVQIPHYQSQENLQRPLFQSQNVQTHHSQSQHQIQKHNHQIMQNLQKAHQLQENQMYKTQGYVSSHQQHPGYVPPHPQYSQYQTKYSLRHSFLQQYSQFNQNVQQEPTQQTEKITNPQPTEPMPSTSGDQCNKSFSYPKDQSVKAQSFSSSISSKEGFDFWMGYMGSALMGSSSHTNLLNKLNTKRKNTEGLSRPAKRALDHPEDGVNDDTKRFKANRFELEHMDGDGGYYTEPDNDINGTIDRDTNDLNAANDRDNNEKKGEGRDVEEPVLLRCDHCRKKTVVYNCSCRRKVYCGQFCQVTDWEAGGHHLHPAHN